VEEFSPTVNSSPRSPLHGQEGVPDHASTKRGSQDRREKRWNDTKISPRKKDAEAQSDDEGSKPGRGGAVNRECGCSFLRLQGWSVFTINFPGVEIPITECVEEIVPGPNHKTFFLFFFLFFFSYCKFCL